MSNENNSEELPKVPFKFDFHFLGLVLFPVVLFGAFLIAASYY